MLFKAKLRICKAMVWAIAVCLIVSTCLLTSIGCGLKWGEKTVEAPAAKISSDRFTCMGEISETMGSFFKDELSDESVKVFMDCIAHSVKTFLDYTRGESSSSYQPDEIRRFLLKYFIKIPISESLLKETMKIKRLLVGGTVEVVERKELQNVLVLLEDIKQLMLQLNKNHFMSVYNLNIGRSMLSRRISLPDVDKAAETLVDVARSLGKILARANVPYSTFSMQRYLMELSRFLFWKDKSSCGDLCNDWVDFIEAFKGIMVGGKDHRFEPEDWSEVFVYGASWYGIVMKYTYYFKPETVLYGRGYERLRETLGLGFDLIGKALTAQGGRNVAYEQIDRLLDSLGKLERLPFGMSSGSLKPVLRVLFDKVFGDTTVAAKRRPSHGLTRRNLSAAREEFERWSETQTFLNQGLMKTWASVYTMEDHEEASNIMAPTEFIKFDLDLWKQQDSNPGPTVTEVLDLAQSIRPFFRQGDPGIQILPHSLTDSDQDRFGIHNLSKINILRSIVRLLYRGFIGDPKRYLTARGVTEPEMQEFSVAARYIGWDLKVMDPRSRKTGHRSFMEANLLTYSGQGMNNGYGKDYIEMAEGIELLAYASVSGHLQTQWHAEGVALCPVGPLDIYGLKTINRACFKRHFRRFVHGGLNHAPKMKDYLEQLSVENWNQISASIFEASWYPCRGSKWIEMAEMSVLTSVIQYAEVIFTRFDSNEDDILDQDELDLAFEIFKGYFAVQAKETIGSRVPEWQLKIIFMFLIEHGRDPKTSEWKDWGLIASDLFRPARANRGMIIDVFKGLSQMVRSKKKKEAEDLGHCQVKRLK